jgi:hypothetical protein
MDYNEFAADILIKQRHAELMAEARRRSLVPPRHPRPLRATVGTALIRAGAWLLREPELAIKRSTVRG